MAGAIRFAFQPGGPLAMFRHEEPAAYLVPAAPLSVALRDPRIMVFLLAWFGLNLLFGIGSIGLPGSEQSIAWEAHIGGVAGGVLLFPPFGPGAAREPRLARPPPGESCASIPPTVCRCSRGG